MKIYTIGFTKKSAEKFFSIIKENRVKKVIDVRLNNSSQLAGFSKGNDLKYFLRIILGINYEHVPDLAPNQEILDSYKKKKISWNQYETDFMELIKHRNPKIITDVDNLDGICFLCSEDTPERCHRRLVAEYIKESNPNKEIELVHI